MKTALAIIASAAFLYFVIVYLMELHWGFCIPPAAFLGYLISKSDFG